MLDEGAPPAARMGLRGTAAAAAKPLPQFLHEGETDTETRRNGWLRGVPGFKGLDNASTEVLRVGSHTSDYALNEPDMQLQAALGAHWPDHAAVEEA
jgi:hypothetical protein